MHPSERAASFRDVIESAPPGSLEEQEALRALDEARHADMNPQPRRRQRHKLRRHWSDRDHALGH
jgi:hypothetical protein